MAEKYFSTLLYSNKLFHQYFVDAYIKIEANRLNWNKTNQKQLHDDQYKGLMDYIESNNTAPIGRITVLSASFQVLNY